MFSFSFSLPLQLFLILSSAAALSLKEKTAIIEELGFHIVSNLKPTNSLSLHARAQTYTHTTHSASVHVSLCPGKKLSPDLHGILNESVLS